MLSSMFIKKHIKRIKNNRIFFTIATYVAYALMRLLFFTCRMQVTIDPALTGKPNQLEGIFFTWHQNIIASAAFLSKHNFRLYVIASPSKDGRFVGTVMQRLGGKMIYGSEHKEPIALVRKSLKALQTHKQLFLIGDGSRGPAKTLQKGAVYLAQKANLPLIFIDCQVSKKIVLKKTWDQFQIPLPFSKIYISLKPQSTEEYL